MNFLTSHKIRAVTVSAASGVLVPAGTVTGANYTTPFIDTQGYDSTVFVCKPSASGAARASIKAQASSSTSTAAEDLAGTLLTGSAAAQALAIEVVRPAMRYVKASITATGGTIGQVWCIQTLPRDKPVSNTVAAASGILSEITISPATGTA